MRSPDGEPRMFVDLTSDLAWRDAYRLAIGFINPRPIALVSSISAAGRLNLAPFSFYNMVCANPPVVMFCPSIRRDGSEKDTLRNVRETREFAIATATESFVEAMNACSAELPPDKSEFDLSGLTPIPATRIKPPLVRESPVNIECVLREIMTISDQPGGGSVIFGNIVAMHIADWVLNSRGSVDPMKLKTVGRLGGLNYVPTRDVFSLPRP